MKQAVKQIDYVAGLKKLNSAINREDKTAAMVEYGISEKTIYVYLAGNGTAATTNESLYNFFLKRLSARLKAAALQKILK